MIIKRKYLNFRLINSYLSTQIIVPILKCIEQLAYSTKISQLMNYFLYVCIQHLLSSLIPVKYMAFEGSSFHCTFSLLKNV